MDGWPEPSSGNDAASRDDLRTVRTANVPLDHPDPIAALAAQLGGGPFSLVTLYSAPSPRFADHIRQLQDHFSEAKIIGCTTAGELSSQGYSEGGMVATALPKTHFATNVLRIGPLDRIDSQDLIGQIIRARATLEGTATGMAHEFAFLLIDGLSRKEDELATTLTSALGGVPLFGGSAGDGTAFQNTYVAVHGKVAQNVAALALVRSHCRAKVFTLNHFIPTDTRMVITAADPGGRIVQAINAEPAARELARIMGKDTNQIDTFTFASNPLVVRFGGSHHVRAIKRVTPEGYLEFFSAIDEGLVLTLADAQDMVSHLETQLAAMSAGGAPDAIIACDCVLRRIEAQQKQKTHALSQVLVRHKVAGFSTYGEQINAMHVNQTMTGVALYPPDKPAK